MTDGGAMLDLSQLLEAERCEDPKIRARAERVRDKVEELIEDYRRWKASRDTLLRLAELEAEAARLRAALPAKTSKQSSNDYAETQQNNRIRDWLRAEHGRNITNKYRPTVEERVLYHHFRRPVDPPVGKFKELLRAHAEGSSAPGPGSPGDSDAA